MSNLEYLKELDAETVKEELLCFLQEEEMDDFTEEFVKFIIRTYLGEILDK